MPLKIKFKLVNKVKKNKSFSHPASQRKRNISKRTSGSCCCYKWPLHSEELEEEDSLCDAVVYIESVSVKKRSCRRVRSSWEQLLLQRLNVCRDGAATPRVRLCPDGQLEFFLVSQHHHVLTISSSWIWICLCTSAIWKSTSPADTRQRDDQQPGGDQRGEENSFQKSDRATDNRAHFYNHAAKQRREPRTRWISWRDTNKSSEWNSKWRVDGFNAKLKSNLQKELKWNGSKQF